MPELSPSCGGGGAALVNGADLVIGVSSVGVSGNLAFLSESVLRKVEDFIVSVRFPIEAVLRFSLEADFDRGISSNRNPSLPSERGLYQHQNHSRQINRPNGRITANMTPQVKNSAR